MSVAVCIGNELAAARWRLRVPNAEAVVKRAAAAALKAAPANAADGNGDNGGEKFSLTVLLAEDDEIRALNRRFRNKDEPTDVLSFRSPNGGDIAVSLQTLVRQSQRDNFAEDTYLGWLIIHGTLHLCGFDHRDDGEAAKMRSMERRLMTRTFGVEPPLMCS